MFDKQIHFSAVELLSFAMQKTMNFNLKKYILLKNIERNILSTFLSV